MATLTGLTIDDFERLPDELARNHELVDGELVDVSGNNPNHIGLRDTLLEILRPFVRSHKLGRVSAEQEYDFAGNAHGPDVSFIGPEKAARLERRRRVQRFVPDLAIEIVSPGDTFEALLGKAMRYRRSGTKEVWIFSIDTREAFRYAEQKNEILGENDLFQSELIPGFSIQIGQLLELI